MDTQAIDKMPAGREMDALVAKKVLGCKVYWEKWSIPPLRRPRCDCEDVYPGTMALSHPHSEGTVNYLKHYSTDIAAAWEIVEVFRRGGHSHGAACIDIKISDWGNLPDCEVTLFGPDIFPVQAIASSVPLAICQAALKAARTIKEHNNDE